SVVLARPGDHSSSAGARPPKSRAEPADPSVVFRKVRDLPHIRRQSREESFMKKRIIILGGCGAMGSELTRDLARTSDFEEIVIADTNLEKAKSLAGELGGERVRAIQVDVSDEDTLARTLRGFDVVANATTYHFGLIATRAAIRTGVN